MKNRRYFIPFILGIVFMVMNTSCGNASVKQDAAATTVSDSAKKEVKDTVNAVVKNTLPVHPVYNDLARYIAGMKVTNSATIDSSLTSNGSWKEYASNFDKTWLKVDTLKIKKMRTWRETELKEANTKTLFYPFSGADFFNANTLFPKAENIIMVGLEPVGTLPTFHKHMSKDSIASYFNKVHTSLYAILNYSFFKTHNMSIDFNNKDLNGTIHLIALFIERTGNSIIDVKPVAVDKEGGIITYKTFKEQRNAGSMNRGVEFDYVGEDNVLKKVYYFSVNLDNSHLNKNPDFVKMITNNKGATTYVKSASYLMHKEVFSSVRNLILDNSNYILQDDSGIPYKYFKPEVWTPALYGTYTGSIPLFTGVFQTDLDEAFKAKQGVKPLKFGIGYKYNVGESNLMYFRKK